MYNNKKWSLLWLIVIYLFLFTNTTSAQEKRKLTLDDIFSSSLLSQESVHGINWMQNGRYYTSLEPDPINKTFDIIKFDITTGKPVETVVKGSELTLNDQTKPIIFFDYSLSTDENKVLLATDIENIYRRSTKATHYVYDLKTKELKKLADGGKESYATFSPDGSKVAYVRDNNLYYKDLSNMKEVAITTDGEFNKIIYGAADWVYEEEFSFAKAFFWSPDSKKIAFYKFDESNVKEYNMQSWGNLYPVDYKFKYPKAGESNSVLDILVHHLPDSKTVSMDIGKEKDIYIPRMYWTNDANLLSIIRMNRLQNQLEILHGNVTTGNTNVVLTEKSNSYVDIDYNDNLTYLKDNKGFVLTSERDGFKHIYLYKMNGELVRQITKGAWEVAEFIGIDESKDLLYFISTEDSPLERQFYSINVKGKNKKKLSSKPGVNDVNMNPDFTYYIQNHSSATEPLTVTLHKAPSGELVKVLKDNSRLRNNLKTVALNTKEFFKFTTQDGVSLNGYMIKPANFDPNKKYPVLMYVYGGPGSQTVMNNFSTSREYWHSYLADQGVIVVSIDNRGTGARGKAFKHITYSQLGKYEVQDQIAGAKYLANLPYVDGDRIGIWGWSYGGYMASLAMFLGADVFKAGIAIAPVTNWRFYDTIYTERYLKTPQLNPGGYDDYSPITHADKLQGAYLLVHGTGDDNVHFQNAVELQNALISAGKQFESFYYPNRNHGIYGGNTRHHLFEMMTNFVLENLKESKTL